MSPDGAVTEDAEVNPHWRRNLAVCGIGSCTTIIAMTLNIPFLPVYVRELGVTNTDDVVRWSGVAYGATFLTAALTAPLWGALGDRYGRKPMLIRASLGMAIATSLIGLAQDVWQLVALRLLVGLLGGYASGSTILVAAQSPKDRSAWAIGVLSTGILAGNVVGPLVGGLVPQAVGARHTFFLTGALIFLAFLATALLLKEDHKPALRGAPKPPRAPIPTATVLPLLVTGSMVMFATMSIEPLVTEFVAAIHGRESAAAWAGLAVALGALGSALAAPRVGRLADRVGPRRVIVWCLLLAAVLAGAQALSANLWWFLVARFAMGLALGGLMPAVTATLRRIAPAGQVGRVLGLGVSAQYGGQVVGPLLGGFAAATFGLRSAFIVTAGVLALLAVVNSRRVPGVEAGRQEQ